MSDWDTFNDKWRDEYTNDYVSEQWKEHAARKAVVDESGPDVPEERIVAFGPGGKDPQTSTPDYSDDGEALPVRRAADVRAEQAAKEAEAESPKPKKRSRRKASEDDEPKVSVDETTKAVDAPKEDEDGKREDRDDGKRTDSE